MRRFVMKKKKAKPHIYVVTKWKSVIPEGGTAAERDSLLSQFFRAVTKKNNKIFSSKTLVHYYGSDLRDWVIMEEYKTWTDIEAADKISQKLIMQKWPNDKKRKEFFQKTGKYFPDSIHSDEIYLEKPMFRK
jgi:hypothetical protein